VSTHTDLAPTFLSLFGLPLRTNMDGKVIADIRPGSQSQTQGSPTEHVNVEMWAPADPYEVAPFKAIESTLKGLANNTYKGLRIQSDDYSLYYSVWCTNEHELYDMVQDPYQTVNLLPQTYDIATQIPPGRPLLGRTMDQVVARLDALMMVLKSCVGVQCTQPWQQLHPGGGVSTLAEALRDEYDGFYGMQPKVGFAKCVNGYVVEHEGPQSALQYNGGV
jgi:N-acetylglucosamine-6-sulfatase